jgi:glyoxylase-like metal-dependent hydrolase (beta-lactamase superfamily II)
VDYVINTHLHFDHVGWNTQLIDKKWEPTFSKAEYIFPKKDFDYWINDPKGEMEDDLLGIKDSIMPVVEANQHKLVDADYQVTDGVKLIATPGHTPGHVSIEVESNGEKAIIAGDLFYHPCQVTELDWTTEVDNDPNQVVKSRKKVFAEVANRNTILLAAHTPTPIAGRVITEAGAYKFQPL